MPGGYRRADPGQLESPCETLDSLVEFFFNFFNGVRKKTEYVRTIYSCGTVGEIRAVEVGRYSNGSYAWGSVSRELNEREREEFLGGVKDERDVRIFKNDSSFVESVKGRPFSEMMGVVTSG